MKFIVASAALALAANADEAAPAATALLEGRKFNSIVGMAHTQVTTSLSKTEFGDKINKYGCHCFPNGSKAAGGTGPAVDAMDALCKKLYKCHKCIQLEYGMDAIDVNDGRYTWAQNGDGSLSCDKNKNNPARLALCECDRAYAYAMKNVWDDDSYNQYYWLNNKFARQNPDAVFNYEETCTANGGGQSADTCCGAAFPDKEPYDSTQRGCCGNSLYNLVTQDCCVDGSVNSIGSC